MSIKEPDHIYPPVPEQTERRVIRRNDPDIALHQQHAELQRTAPTLAAQFYFANGQAIRRAEQKLAAEKK